VQCKTVLTVKTILYISSVLSVSVVTVVQICSVHDHGLEICPLLTQSGETANYGVRPLMFVSITCLHLKKSSVKRYIYIYFFFSYHKFHVHKSSLKHGVQECY